MSRSQSSEWSPCSSSARELCLQAVPAGYVFSYTHPHVPQEVPEVCSWRPRVPVRALQFGLASAPWIFTQVMSQMKAMVHLQGIQLDLYFDDWLSKYRTSCWGNTRHRPSRDVTSLCSELGPLVNLEKLELVPSQSFDFIGATFDLAQTWSCRRRKTELE